MAKVTLHQDVSSGMWKFKGVPVDVLCELAQDWLTHGPYTENYIGELHVRKCSKDQYGIGFMYRTSNNDGFETFFDRITDQLKRKFGNQFIGWDVAKSTWMIG